MKTKPPFNFDIEQAVLSALISKSNEQQSKEVIDECHESDFYDQRNKLIFRYVRRMVEKNIPIDSLSLTEKLSESGKLEAVGGYGYVSSLAQVQFSLYTLTNHAKTLSDLRLKRDLLELSFKLNGMIESKEQNEDIINSIEEDLKDLSLKTGGTEIKHIREASGEWLDELQRREDSGGSILGLRTGFDQLDERLCGIGKESLVTIVGRPSHGKTLFTQAICQNVGLDQNKDTLFFSMEMSGNEVYERFVSGIGNVLPEELRTARFSSEGLGRVERAVHTLDNSRIHYTDNSTQTLGQIRSRVRKFKNKNPALSLVVIDYLGLMELPIADRHDIAIGKVTKGLKQLAKELKVPVILICQAGRGLDKTNRPTMSDIKDSSSIEADSDVVIFVHRQEIADPDTPLKGITEIIIAKDRHNNGNGTVYMQKINGSFKELSSEEAGRIQMQAEQFKQQKGMS